MIPGIAMLPVIEGEHSTFALVTPANGRMPTFAAMSDMRPAYFLLGSNLGDRLAQIQYGLNMLERLAGPAIQRSGVYETAPWGIEDQPAFLNQVAMIPTSLLPSDLLKHIRHIEEPHSRPKPSQWGPRKLDIDILFYGNEVVQSPELVIPHPRIASRRFTLVPLAEIAPGFIHPVLHKSVSEMLDDCPDPLSVVRWSPRGNLTT